MDIRLPHRPLIAAGIASLALGIVGCGSSSSSAPSSSASTTKTAAGPNPNGPEVSPSGDIPDNQAYVPFAPAGAGYTVTVPEGWGQTPAKAGASFTDKLNSIAVASAPASVPLTVAQASRTVVPNLAVLKGYQRGAVSNVNRKAGSAVRITYLAAGPTDPVTGKTPTNAVEQYVFFHNGKRVTLTLSGPKGADNVDPWKIVTDSLRWTR